MAETVIRGKFATPVSRRQVAETWAARGYSCTDFSDPPGRSWNDFVHDTNELVTVIEGRLEMRIEDQTLLVDAGDEVFIPRAARHSVKNVHNSTTRWLFGYD